MKKLCTFPFSGLKACVFQKSIANTELVLFAAAWSPLLMVIDLRLGPHLLLPRPEKNLSPFTSCALQLR